MSSTQFKFLTSKAIAVMQAFIDGETIEVKTDEYSNRWLVTETPAWNWREFNYRVKEERDDEIDWSQVHPSYLSMTRNENGNAYLHATRAPNKLCATWASFHWCRVSQPSYKMGTKSWDKSLVLRPK